MSRLNPHISREDEILSELLKESLEPEVPSTQLRDRIAQMAAVADAKQVPTSTTVSPKRNTRRFAFAPRFRFALSAATATCVIAVISLVWPRVMTTQALARVEAAMAKVSSVHMVNWKIEKGKRVKDSETWFQNGQWRVERNGGATTTVYKLGKQWFYDAVSQTVTMRRTPNGPFAHNPSGFTLAALVRDFESQGSKTSVTFQGTDTIDGREVKNATLETRTDYETTTVLLKVDSETDLPLRGDMTNRTRYGQESHGEFTFAYNVPFKASLFEPKFARAVRFVDQARETDKLEKRLTRGLVRQKVGERTITIRDLQVNERGAVFVLYTAGKRIGDAFSDGKNRYSGRDWKIYLTDSLGTRYLWLDPANFQPTMFKNYTFDGARLEGDWWVPEATPDLNKLWRSRTFTLSFEVNPKNLHGAYSGKKQFSPDYSGQVRFQVPVTMPSAPVVPDVVRPLNMGVDEQSILREESHARGDLPPGVQPSTELVRVLMESDDEWYFSFSPDGKQLASSGAKGIRVWDLAGGRTLHTFQGSSNPELVSVGEPLFSPDGRTLCAALAQAQSSSGTTVATKGQVALWDLDSGKLRASWPLVLPANTDIRNVAFSPDGQRLRFLNGIITKRGGDGRSTWVESMNAVAQERDILTGRDLSNHILPHDNFVFGTHMVSSEPDGWRILTNQNANRSVKGKVLLWNGEDGKLLKTIPLPSEFLIDCSALGLSPQESIVAVAGTHYSNLHGMHHEEGRDIQLFDGSSGQLLRTLQPQNRAWIRAMAISPDGQTLACEGNDFTVDLWDVSTGRLRQSLVGHYSGIRQLIFSPDSKMLVSDDMKGKVLQWQLQL